MQKNPYVSSVDMFLYNLNIEQSTCKFIVYMMADPQNTSFVSANNPKASFL